MADLTTIFHFILDPRVGGPHNYVRTLGGCLPKSFHTVIATSGSGPMTDIRLFNLRHWLRWLYPFELILNTTRLCWMFRRYRSRQRIVFDAHGAANLAPIFAARIMNIPLVWHFHETVSEFRLLVRLGKIVAKGVPHCTVVVARQAFSAFNLPDATLISGAVDLNFWASAKIRPRPPLGPGRLRILSVGNLNPLKGADLLLAALGGVTHPLELVIVGAELRTHLGYAKGLQELTNRLEGPTRRIRFVGWQSPEEIRTLMLSSDVFVLPSRSEACPLALLEAMAAGCVCIATDVGDVREILEVAGCGIVVPCESSWALSAAINHVAKISAAERCRMGQLAQETIATRYSIEIFLEKHMGIYRKVTSIIEEIA